MLILEDGANTVAEYEYDGLNRRIVKKAYSGGSLDWTDHYYYNSSWQVLEVRRDTGSGEDSDPREQYVWHPYYIDALATRFYDATMGSATSVAEVVAGKRRVGSVRSTMTIGSPRGATSNSLIAAGTNASAGAG